MYSTLTTTNRPPEKIIPLLKSIQSQTIQPEHIFLICDKIFTEKTFQKYKEILKNNLTEKYFQKIKFITNLKDKFIPGNGVSYNRNFGISKIKTPLLLSVDDDNIFEKDFIERMINISKSYQKEFKSAPILVPTEYYEGNVRSRGYTKFRYRLCAQKSLIKGKNLYKNKTILINKEKLYPIQFASSNCFFGPTKIFKQNSFDERMKFIYEDFDFLKKITNTKIPLLVTLDLNIDHKMRKKTKLEESYLEDAAGFGLYEKSKNRILFVKNTGNFREKLSFYIFGLRVHSFFLLLKILRYAGKSKRNILIKQLFNGTIDGLFTSVIQSEAKEPYIS